MSQEGTPIPTARNHNKPCQNIPAPSFSEEKNSKLSATSIALS